MVKYPCTSLFLDVKALVNSTMYSVHKALSGVVHWLEHLKALVSSLSCL